MKESDLQAQLKEDGDALRAEPELKELELEEAEALLKTAPEPREAGTEPKDENFAQNPALDENPTLEKTAFSFNFGFNSNLPELVLKQIKKEQNSKPDKADTKMLKKVFAGNDVVLEYQPFAAITRWRKQQERSLKRDLKPVLFIVVPILLFSAVQLLHFFSSFETRSSVNEVRAQQIYRDRKLYEKQINQRKIQSTYSPILNSIKILPERIRANFFIDGDGKIRILDVYRLEKRSRYIADAELKFRFQKAFDGAPVMDWSEARYARGYFLLGGGKWASKLLTTNNASYTSPAPVLADFESKRQETAQANQMLGTYLLWTSLLTVIMALILVARQPSHIGVSQEGWRFLWRRPFRNKNGKYILWNDITRVYMERAPRSTSPADGSLCFFCANDKKVKIKMGALESVEDREFLLKALEKWAPKVPRDPEVMQALQAPADHSYTELWLQALSAPPKRERLKPLAEGNLLKKGKYAVIDQIGMGGQGNAYLCLNQDGGKVVLKECVLPVFVDSNVRRSALEQFENEAKLLRQLEHEQIVKLLDFFVEDHRTYLVLEHIDGPSLSQLVKDRGALKEEDVRAYAKQMCEILNYLHGLTPPVVHRDFTPDNLIIHKDGTLKLIDFNVAKQLSESTMAGTVVGKHAYLPPEQFRGMPVCASDIYAMGATLHFLITGKDPEPISCSHPRTLVNTISESLNALVEKATALDLKKRYQSIKELQDDLETACS